MTATELDLDDTSSCNPASKCSLCNARGQLSVKTATTLVGVICLTLCAGCVAAGRSPRLSPAQAAVMSLEHCQHLGITADAMAELMAAATRDGPAATEATR